MKSTARLIDEEEPQEEKGRKGSQKISQTKYGDVENDEPEIVFSGKKKKKKLKSKKGSGGNIVFSTSSFGLLEEEDNDSDGDNEGKVIDLVELEKPNKDNKSEEVVETSKKKKKKKKSEQEEDDIDKILAELDVKVKVQVEPELVAAKKKKKNKKENVKEEKQEETRSGTIEPKKNEGKSKGVDKKVPKHVREMQEVLARRKEVEERKKREEEERLRKEEEERRREEEVEREMEEARRRKKEKALKKKQEGKVLTGKQKEEARRLEAMRNQILANAGSSLPTLEKEGEPAKRPKYETKKSKASHKQANGSAENVETNEKQQENEAEENVSEKDEDEEEWDAKISYNLNHNVKGAFNDEEADSEPEPVVSKEIKAAAAKKTIPLQPAKSHDVENKKSQADAEVADKNTTKQAAVKSKAAANSNANPKQGEDNLRSPICCIMGHVDTGKTKLLDCIRRTNVQQGEAGGITQQIGATYFPAENIRERTKELKADAKLKVPGLLVIDTPGHESFTNLRSRGSGLCDIAILVVDIMHGLEPQTIESLNLLKLRNTEFIVALNKVDRLYGWKTCHNAPIVKAMKQQSKDVQNEFNTRLTQIITQFKEQGLNTELYYKNKEMGETFSIVPTSAISGEGIPDLLLLLVQWTQKTMVEKLKFSNEVQCTVLEVKVIEGLGTTIDVVLVNGVLHDGDQIVVCGLQGPIVTTIRALLTPHPMKEIRVKGDYLRHTEIKAAQGIKITAQGLEHAIAGTGLYVVGPDDDLEYVKEAVMEDMKSVMSRIDKTGEGVYVHASTLGSLEALLEFLKSPEVSIPVSGIGIGPIHKKDVMKASVMLEKKKEYATILAFDIKVTPEARKLADDLGVKIFTADIIYHLFDQFKAYFGNLKEEKKREGADEVVFPCVLKILPNCIFNKKDPIILGVDVLEGIAKVGTPICIPQKDFIDIGVITSIENNHKQIVYAKKGQKVTIKIVGTNSEEQQKMYGRHFDLDVELVSHISRKSIDILKANHRDELSLEDWRLVVRLKTLFRIQ